MNSTSTSTTAWLWLPRYALWFVERGDEAWWELECGLGTCHAMGRTSKRMRRAWDTGIAEDEVHGKVEGEGREICGPAFIQHRVYVPSPGALTGSVRGSVEPAPVLATVGGFWTTRRLRRGIAL